MSSTLMEAYLAEIRTLWPASAPRLVGRGAGDGARDGAGDGTVLIALPDARQPRLLVPAENPVAASRAMLRFSSGLDVRDTLKRVAVAGVLRTPVRSAFPDRVVTGGDQGSLRAYLAGVLGSPVDVSLGIGTARANRKPVLQAFDGAGRSLAFVKVGSTAAAEPHVAAEERGLRCVGESRLPAHFEVPRLLHTGRYDGHLVVAMSSLDTWCWQRPKRAWSLPEDEMTAFARTFADRSMPLVETPLWQRLLATRSGLADEAARDRLGAVLMRLESAATGVALEVGGWHGDWTPWNMSRRRGRLQLWDLERFDTGVPVGLDRYHYAVNAVIRRDGPSSESVRRGLVLGGAQHTRRGDREHLLAATYLATVSARYLEQAESDLGDTVLLRSRAVLQALETWLDVEQGVAGEGA